MQISKLLSIHKYEHQYEVLPADELFDSGVLIGLEYELEECYADTPVQFHKIGDGSLRGYKAFEFVLKKPLRGGFLVDAIYNLEEAMLRVPLLSERCSLHVHYNVSDWDSEDIAKAIIILVTIEPLLFNYVGEERASNPYCIPLAQWVASAGSILRIVQTLRKSSYTPDYKLIEDLDSSSKYNAVNLQAITKFGSIEFRHKGGAYEAVDVLEWINIISMVMSYAKQYKHPIEELPLLISSNGISDYVDSIFGIYANTVKYSGYQIDVIKSVRLAQVLTDDQDQEELVKLLTGTHAHVRILNIIKRSQFKPTSVYHALYSAAVLYGTKRFIPFT